MTNKKLNYSAIAKEMAIPVSYTHLRAHET